MVLQTNICISEECRITHAVTCETNTREKKHGKNYSEEAGREEDVILYHLHGSEARRRRFEGAMVQARRREK